MLVAPLPQDEAKRLDALANYEVLDAPAEAAFDELTSLASRICEVPIALVSLVDTNRQWFLSRHGLDATETPRDIAFCAHAILGDAPLVVEDALQDARFADNPLVTDAPGIRFYAGAPLTTPRGHRVGAADACAVRSSPANASGFPLRKCSIASGVARRCRMTS